MDSSKIWVPKISQKLMVVEFPTSLCGVLVFVSVSRPLLLPSSSASSATSSTQLCHTYNTIFHCHTQLCHTPSLVTPLGHIDFVLRGTRGTYENGWDLVARLRPVSRPWRRGTLCGRRGTCSHRPPFCVAGMALMAPGWVCTLARLVAVGREWHRGTLRGRRGTWRHTDPRPGYLNRMGGLKPLLK